MFVLLTLKKIKHAVLRHVKALIIDSDSKSLIRKETMGANSQEKKYESTRLPIRLSKTHRLFSFMPPVTKGEQKSHSQTDE